MKLSEKIKKYHLFYYNQNTEWWQIFKPFSGSGPQPFSWTGCQPYPWGGACGGTCRAEGATNPWGHPEV